MFSDIYTQIERRNKSNADNGLLAKVKPVVDIYETENSIVILAEMPRVDKEDLHIQVEKGILHIRGKRQNSAPEGEYILRETADVIYERFFELENNLDPENIKAAYHAGVLKITIGKSEQAKPRKIEING
ncbi:MAG: Hsp20/alpha crystallin family protein [bacterium]|nr:MAG: Hsp20/alpha crystallin family protein [bacterium]